MSTKTRKTTDAIEILHDRYIRGRPEAEALLDDARSQLQLSMKLHQLRENEGLTQKEVADRAGTSRTVIARLENPGYEKHTISTLRKVAGAMGYRVQVDFVRSSPRPTPKGTRSISRPRKLISGGSGKQK